MGEWHYLLSRYSEDEAHERRDRIGQTIKRLVRKGRDAEQLHRALMLGIQRYQLHADQRTTRSRARKWNAEVASAEKAVDHALSKLRRLLPPEFPKIDDDTLFELRHEILRTVEVVPSPRPRGGRPWEWKHDTDEALRKAGVVANDRRELIAALGFVDDE